MNFKFLELIHVLSIDTFIYCIFCYNWTLYRFQMIININISINAHRNLIWLICIISTTKNGRTKFYRSNVVFGSVKYINFRFIKKCIARKNKWIKMDAQKTSFQLLLLLLHHFIVESMSAKVRMNINSATQFFSRFVYIMATAFRRTFTLIDTVVCVYAYICSFASMVFSVLVSFAAVNQFQVLWLPFSSVTVRE